MYLQSFTFLFLALPIFIFLYYVFRQNNVIVLLFSILFYLLLDIKYSVLLLLVCVITWLFGKNVKNKSTIYILYLIILILILSVFKFKDLIIMFINATSFSMVAVPVGLSYYIFKAISYVSDVYRDKYEPSSLYKVSSYLTFFPTILQGPIIRFDGFNSWLDSKVEKPFDAIADGLRRYILGLAKVSIVAPALLTLSNVSFEETYLLNQFLTWTGVTAYACMLYFDFSGNSDMSIGISAMLGYKVEENFDHPYESETVSEFFNRWHITLGSFFKDYIYIPLGGNRKGIVKTLINIMIVWLLTGLWHSNSVTTNINFIVWGLFLGVIICLEKIIYKKVSINKYVKKIITILCVLVSWVFFKSSSFRQALRYIKRMLIGEYITLEYVNFLNIYFYLFVLVISLVLCFKPIRERINILFQNKPLIKDIILIGMLILSIMFIVINGQYSPIYANF